MSHISKVNQIFLIIIDDVRSSHFFELMAQGKLPNMLKLSIEGLSCQNCITSFPSVTFPCYPNIITGTYSGYFHKEGSGIPSYHWIARDIPPSEDKKHPFIRNYDDRRNIRKIGKDLGNNCKTIFEQAGEGNFLSIVNLIFRGSQFAAPLKYNTEMIFKTAEECIINPKKFFSIKEIPKITIIYVPITDEIMHNKGFDHIDYIKELRKCDECIGSLISLLKENGYYKDTTICIVSDHGNYKAQYLYDIEPFFKKLGLKQYNPKLGIGDFDANIGSIGFFNFRGDNWNYHPNLEQMKSFQPSGTNTEELNLFETLWKIPGVKFMYYKNDNSTPENGTIHLEKKNENTGEIIKGIIEYQGHGKNQKTKYIFENEELFDYQKFENSSKLLDYKPHNIDEWLAETYNIDFPIFIDQLPRYFKNPRSCDIMISTRGIYGFNFEHGSTVSNKFYNHDIASQESMTVPLIIGGSSEVPNTTLNYCKTTDIVPTLLDLIGFKPDKTVVGKSLLNK